MTDVNALESLYFAALEKAPEARSAYLDDACRGNPGLRVQIDRLLVARPQVGGFLEPAAGERTNSFGGPAATKSFPGPGSDEALGTVVAGRYKLIEVIGEGGMGAVYMAQQTEPVKRLVAVKVIRAGMDTKTVLARFEAERQALAMMDHPNIAKVLDAGVTDGNRPYFVMELVKGVPITKFCDDHKLPPRERLELFVPVCQAIQHAHQKGVIHRDVKPNNVLVAMYDDRPVPKVIDFGVAKATGPQLTDHTLVTSFGAVVGTPEYMSPEQASFNQMDVDTRSDVYSLGVLLYELLTGTTPIDRKSLGKAAVLEVLRIVRENEPPKPSTRLSTDAALPTIAASRGVEPTKLTKLMRGELDWIVMKALDKDRTRRYETANGLARDVQRYLTNDLIEARPPTLGYRVRKTVRKHKAQVLAASLLVLALLGGIAGTSWGLVRANRSESVARDEEQKAIRERDEKEKALGREIEGKAALNVALTNERQAAYDMTIPLAQKALQDNDDAAAAELLDSCPALLRGFEWNLLNRLLDRGSLTLRPGFIMARNRFARPTYRFSPDSKTAVFVSQYSAGFAVQVWDTGSGELIGSWNSESKLKGIWHRFELDPAARVLAVWAPFIPRNGDSKIDDPTTVVVLDVRTGTELYRLSGHTAAVSHVAFHPNGKRIATGSRDRTVRIWGPGGKEELVLSGHQSKVVLPLAFLPGKNQLLSLGRQHGYRADMGPETNPNQPGPYTPDPDELKVWDLDTQSAVLDVTLPPAERTALYGKTEVRLSKSGRYAVITDEEVPNALIDLTTGERPLSLPGNYEIIAVDPTETRALCYTSQMVVCEVNISTGRTEKSFRLTDGLQQTSFALTSPGTENRPRTRKRWTVCLTPDGRRLVLAHDMMGNRVTVYDTATGRAVRSVSFDANRSSYSMALALSPDGRKFLTANSTQQATLWDIDRSRVVSDVLKVTEGTNTHAVAVSPDGQRIAITEMRSTTTEKGRRDRQYRWGQIDAKTGRRLPGDGPWTVRTVTNLVYSPDGTRIGALFHDTVRLRATDNLAQLFIPVEFDSRTGQRLYTGKEYLHRREPLHDEGRYNPHVAYTPAGILICSNYRPADETRKAGRWMIEDVAAEKVLFSIPDPAGRALRLAPGGRFAALFGRTNDATAVEVWDVVEGRKLWDRPNDRSEPRSYLGAFAPNGRRLLSFEQVMTSSQLNAAGILAPTPLAVVWNTTTGEKVSSFRPPARSHLGRADFTPNGERLLFTNGDRDHAFTVLFNADTGRQLLTLTDLDERTQSYGGVFLPDGRFLSKNAHGATAEDYARIHVFDGTPGRGDRKLERTVDDWLDRVGRLVDAETLPPKASDEALNLSRRAVERYPVEYECWKMWGLALLGAGKAEDALAAMTRAKELSRHYPPHYRAQNQYLLALTQRRLNRPAEANAAFEAGEAELVIPYTPNANSIMAAWTSVPVDNDAQRPKTLRYRAAVAGILGLTPGELPPEASGPPDRFIVSTPPPFRLLRAAEVAKRGDPETAVRLTEEALRGNNLNPIDCYNAACNYSLSVVVVKGDAALREKYSRRAVELLNRTLAEGLIEFVEEYPRAFNGNPLEHMKQDTDLDPLRGRQDFQRLLAELETKLQARKKEPARDEAPPPHAKKQLSLIPNGVGTACPLRSDPPNVIWPLPLRAAV